MQPPTPPVAATVATPQPTLNNGNPTPKQLYDGLIDLLKILHHPDQQENMTYSSEIKDMLEQLFQLIPTIVEFDPKAPKTFNDQADIFKDQILSTTTTFAKIRLLAVNSPLARVFLVHLQTALTTSLQAKLIFCLNLKRIIRDEYTQKNTDLGYSGAVVVNFLTKLALPEKVKEVRKPSFTSRGGENSAQLSGIPGDAGGHWFAAGPPASQQEAINLTERNIERRFPPYVMQVIQQLYEDDCNRLDNEGTLPTHSLRIIGGDAGRFQVLQMELPVGPGRIGKAFRALILREFHFNRIHTVTEAATFLANYLTAHPNVIQHMNQAAGWGENVAMNRAVIRTQMGEIIRGCITEGKLEDDRPQQAP